MSRVLRFLMIVLALSGCLAGPGSHPQSHPPSDGGSSPSPAPRGADGVPKMTTGDHWVYRVFTEDEPDQTLRTIDLYIDNTEQINSGSDTVQAFRIQIDGGNRTEWIRTNDWAFVRDHLGKDNPNGQETNFAPPCHVYKWPMAVGSNVNETCHATLSGAGAKMDENVTSATTVESTETVTVPAGTFSTFKMTMKGPSTLQGGPSTQYFALDACAPVRVVNQQDGQTLVLELVAYACGTTA